MKYFRQTYFNKLNPILPDQNSNFIRDTFIVDENEVNILTTKNIKNVF